MTVSVVLLDGWYVYPSSWVKSDRLSDFDRYDAGGYWYVAMPIIRVGEDFMWYFRFHASNFCGGPFRAAIGMRLADCKFENKGIR